MFKIIYVAFYHREEEKDREKDREQFMYCMYVNIDSCTIKYVE